MIGRGALGNPQIFARLLGKEWKLSLKETIFAHIDFMFEAYGDRYTFVNMRKHLGFYLKGVSGQKELKQKLFTITGTQSLKEEIDKSLR